MDLAVVAVDAGGGGGGGVAGFQVWLVAAMVKLSFFVFGYWFDFGMGFDWGGGGWF